VGAASHDQRASHGRDGEDGNVGQVLDGIGAQPFPNSVVRRQEDLEYQIEDHESEGDEGACDADKHGQPFGHVTLRLRRLPPRPRSQDGRQCQPCGTSAPSRSAEVAVAMAPILSDRPGPAEVCWLPHAKWWQQPAADSPRAAVPSPALPIPILRNVAPSTPSVTGRQRERSSPGSM
jgi:hypothetical protein